MSGTNRERPAGRNRTTGAATAGGAGQAVLEIEPPRPLRIAVLLMYAGAALTVAGLAADVIELAVGGAAGLKAGHPHATHAQLHATLSALITSIVFSGLIEAALWLFIARASRSGVSWARIVASGLFGVNTVLLVTGFLGTSPATSKAFAALTWLVGAAAVWFLWQPESSAYFSTPTAPPASGATAPPSSATRSGRQSASG